MPKQTKPSPAQRLKKAGLSLADAAEECSEVLKQQPNPDLQAITTTVEVLKTQLAAVAKTYPTQEAPMETTFGLKAKDVEYWNAADPAKRESNRAFYRGRARRQAKEVGASIAIIVDTKGNQVDAIEVQG